MMKNRVVQHVPGWLVDKLKHQFHECEFQKQNLNKIDIFYIYVGKGKLRLYFSGQHFCVLKLLPELLQ